MKTFLTVKLALIPFAIFWALLGARHADWAIWSGLALSAAGNAWRIWRREFMTLEAGGFALFALLAAIHLAVDMVDEGLITKKEAVARVEPQALDQLLHPVFEPRQRAKAAVAAKGLPASPGAATGAVVFTADDAVAWSEKGKRVVLVRMETVPDDIHGMNVSQGILTATGGMTCVSGETLVLTDRGAGHRRSRRPPLAALYSSAVGGCGHGADSAHATLGWGSQASPGRYDDAPRARAQARIDEEQRNRDAEAEHGGDHRLADAARH